jgi:hypothetical protein
LRYTENYAAGKNKVINGDFYVNQRNFTTISGGGYGFDRFNCATSGATATSSAQTFALGTAPVAGYEGKNFLRWDVTTGNDFCRVLQTIESVRTLAGQTATLSFWAKGTNPATAGNLRVRLQQYFGTGGSPSASVALTEQTFVLTGAWTRYSFTFAVPSISGKTIGTNNDDGLQIDIGQLSNASTDAWTLDLWGVQLEAGSVATAFQTSTGTIQGELAACQRYYYRNAGGQVYSHIGFGMASSTTAMVLDAKLPTTMRTKPASIEYSNVAVNLPGAGNTAITNLTITATESSPDIANLVATVASGLTQYRPYFLLNDNNAAGYVAFSAEL